jgi:DnaK suppressor protein
MNSKTVQQLKSELISKKQSLMSLQAQNNKVVMEQDSDLKDSVDRSEAEEAWFTKERMSQHWKSELIQINTALNKIETGEFGVCAECDSEIPVKRLRVRPDAILCLYCQESAEKEMGPQRGVRPSPPVNLVH